MKHFNTGKGPKDKYTNISAAIRKIWNVENLCNQGKYVVDDTDLEGKIVDELEIGEDEQEAEEPGQGQQVGGGNSAPLQHITVIYCSPLGTRINQEDHDFLL